MARGSNLELQTQLVIARKLGMGDAPKVDLAEALSTEVGKMLIALMGKIGNKM
jgi:four helix bundle protein